VGFFYFYAMNIKNYLDSTYLKTAEQAGISELEDEIIVKTYIQEAIDEGFKLIMIRPQHVSLAKKMIQKTSSKLAIGTVIDFPLGRLSIKEKLVQANQAIHDGADDLDFVCNYMAFKNGEISLIKNEIFLGSKLGLENNKSVKWIIEVAALTDMQIIQISALIKNVIIANFKEEKYNSVFVKSSTGFYYTEDSKPNGATKDSIIQMLENSFPLSVKASGGIKNLEDAQEYIQLGVKRIGTSSAKEIANGITSKSNY
jgi:deoxyribose-phosphate aldolase